MGAGLDGAEGLALAVERMEEPVAEANGADGPDLAAGGPAAAQGRRPTEFSQRAQGEEFSRQKAKISGPGRGPDWGGIFRGWEGEVIQREGSIFGGREVTECLVVASLEVCAV
jgi:hypothetical protein